MGFLAVGPVLAGFAALLLVVGLTTRGPSAVVQRLAAGRAAALSGAPVPVPSGAVLRTRAVAWLASMGRGRTPEGLERRLRWAGIAMPPEAWRVLPFPLAAAGAVAGFAAGLAAPAYAVVAAVAGAGLGAAVPSWILSGRLAARRARVARDVLTYTEYLVMAMRAGADFQIAVAQVAARFPGAVSEAFTAAVRSGQIGGRMDDGLRAAQAELQNRDADAIVETLVKNLQYGSRCADMLLDMAQAVRRERVERVMERASRAALLLLVPIVVFIMPVIFGLVIYPMVGGAIRLLG